MQKRNFNQNKDLIREAMIASGKYSNVMSLPELKKIVLNIGAGKAAGNSNYLKEAVEGLTLISGQKPVVTKAKVSESNFKLRKGAPIGVKVTLRGRRMYDFFNRLVNYAIPRIRDFNGLSLKSFDGRGNYTFGIKEHLIFHEIDFDKVSDVIGMDVTFVTSAVNDEDALHLLIELGLPFKKERV